ncbi:hypothetical protein LIER_20938 [Lithospermum erythrorhizon]|uniref:Water stress and hypersensitive response domain-containing protein n=1 Tax=Lithospermum erythrorhizon TaxID=34254 RepID=A0AAV3QND3_LITER
MDLIDKITDFVSDKVADLPKPEASVTDVDVKDITLTDGVTYLAKVAVKNPYGVSLPISDVEYILKSATRIIVSGKIPDPGSLKASDTTMVNVDVKVPHSILLSLIKDIVGDWDLDYELEIKLIIDLPVIGNFTLPVAQKGEMKLPTWRQMIGLESTATADE